MALRVLLLCALVLVSCRSPGSTGIAEARADDRAPAGPGTAVVELFTSEGCSSCPPAEAVLGDLAASSRAAGQRVLSLELHVDYWDGIGWPGRLPPPAL